MRLPAWLLSKLLRHTHPLPGSCSGEDLLLCSQLPGGFLLSVSYESVLEVAVLSCQLPTPWRPQAHLAFPSLPQFSDPSLMQGPGHAQGCGQAQVQGGTRWYLSPPGAGSAPGHLDEPLAHSWSRCPESRYRGFASLGLPDSRGLL